MSSRQQTQAQAQALLQLLSPQQQQAYRQLPPDQKVVLLQQNQVYYRVCKPEIDSVAPDPLDPIKCYHDGVWVENDPKRGKGVLFHVTGDIIAASGMRYNEKRSWAPGQSGRLCGITTIGYVLKTDYESGRISMVLRALPTPSKQQGINFWQRDHITGKHELIWTKEDGEPYALGEQRRPIFKCNEWTDQYAIPALRNAGILSSYV